MAQPGRGKRKRGGGRASDAWGGRTGLTTMTFRIAALAPLFIYKLVATFVFVRGTAIYGLWLWLCGASPLSTPPTPSLCVARLPPLPLVLIASALFARPIRRHHHAFCRDLGARRLPPCSHSLAERTRDAAAGCKVEQRRAARRAAPRRARSQPIVVPVARAGFVRPCARGAEEPIGGGAAGREQGVAR